jgi:hypothetical protein
MAMSQKIGKLADWLKICHKKPNRVGRPFVFQTTSRIRFESQAISPVNFHLEA